MKKLSYNQLEIIIEQISSINKIAPVVSNEIIFKPSQRQLEEKLEEELHNLFSTKKILKTYEVSEIFGMCKKSVLNLHHSKKLIGFKLNPMIKNSPLRFSATSVKDYFIETLLNNQ